MLLHAARNSRCLPRLGRCSGSTTGAVLRAAISFVSGEPRGDTLARLEGLGVELVRSRGRALHVGHIYAARVPLDSVEPLAAMAEVVEVDARPFGPRPEATDNYPAFIEARQTWPSLDPQGVPLTGAGVTVGVIDSWLDIFHPSFFRPDGGYVEWVDVDQNQAFSPGIDGIDRDGDGTIGATERLQVLDGALSWSDEETHLENVDGKLTPDLDWLFLDLNGSQAREFGAQAGFVESSPAYGEPLYVADDVDADGVLDPEEKLVGLRTSKIRTVGIPFDFETFDREPTS